MCQKWVNKKFFSQKNGNKRVKKQLIKCQKCVNKNRSINECKKNAQK